MEEGELSAQAKQQIIRLKATNERLLAEGLELEVCTQELEALAQRKANLVRRCQEFLAEIQADHQAITSKGFLPPI